MNEHQRIKDALTNFYCRRGIEQFLENCTESIITLQEENKKKQLLIDELREVISYTLKKENINYRLSEQKGFWQCVKCNCILYPTIHNINKHEKECKVK